MRVHAVVVLLLLAAAGVAADLQQWEVICGLADNPYPYPNDCLTRFGVQPTATWNYDARDCNHPVIDWPDHALGFVYDERYYLAYERLGYGWPPPWKPWIPSDARPDYLGPGLLKDLREAILVPGCPELWQVKAYAPITGLACSFVWRLNTERGFEAPANIRIRVLANPDLAAAGYTGDIVLTDWGLGTHKITGIPQWGMDDEGIDPIRHLWIIEAYMVPEPGTCTMMGLAIIAFGMGILRRRS